ncbi:MAG: TRAP transporter substrate-binding protein [Intestinimonas sp.]|jgi:tripartite ATP-independent transporter DctP family solute receptor|nr:TRAP transporter substrate-binding protein [Intestinimonas sp.]
MKIKKMTALALATAMAFTLLSGCGGDSSGSDNSAATVSPSGSAAPTESSAGSSSGSYNVDNLSEATYKVNTSAKAATLQTPGYGEAIQYFCDQVKERSGGKINMEIYTDAQLGGSADEMISGVTTGAFEFITLNQGSWGDYTDAFMPFNLPFLFSDFNQAYKFMDNGMADTITDNIAQDTGVHVLCYFDMGFRDLTNNRGEIKTASDMKGLKMRTQSDPYQIATFEALGTNVTTVSYSELYSALQQGLVDAQENPLSNIVLQKYYEVQKYLTLTNHTYTLTTMACSEDMWNSWNTDTQNLFKEVAADATTLCRKGLETSVQTDLDTLKSKMDVYQPTDEELQTFKDAAAPVYDKIKDAMGQSRYNQIVSAAEAAKD